MVKLLQNMKLSTSIVCIVILGLLSTVLIGGMGYYSIGTINKNIGEMYSDRLLPTAYSAEIGIEFIKSRLYVTQALRKYDPAKDTAIKESQKIIEAALDNFTHRQLDSQESSEIEKIKSNYSEYLKKWEAANDMMSRGEQPSDEYVAQFASLGKNIQDALDNLRKYEIKLGETLNGQSNSLYHSTMNIFYAILIISILLLAVVSYLIIMVIRRSSNEMIQALETVSQGDFTVKLDNVANNEFGKMKSELKKSIGNISTILLTVKDNSNSINEASSNLSDLASEMETSTDNVATAIEDVAKGTSSQAEDLANINGILNKFAENLANIVLSIENVDVNSKEIHGMAGESSSNMQTLVKSVGRVTDAFKDLIAKISSVGQNISQINEITNLINSISDQTNLLALNAAIEAARAGEAGRGFAVVADEIRKLAEQSKVSSENINTLISNISSETNTMVKTTDIMKDELIQQRTDINNAIESFEKIIVAVEEVIPKIEEVNTSARSIDDEKNQIIDMIENASAIAEEVSASSEEISASSQEVHSSVNEVTNTSKKLDSMAKDMTDKINRFRL